MLNEKILKGLEKVVDAEKLHLDVPENEEFGDYSSNIAMQMFSKSQISSTKSQKNLKSPRELAEEIVNKLKADKELMKYVEKIEIAGGGFINFFLKNTILFEELGKILQDEGDYGSTDLLRDKKIMVEFAHPNTHKELHIGHMRTLT